MIMLCLAGLWTIKNIPSSLDPPQPQAVVYVDVAWPGASAEDVEQLVTNPIEQQLYTLNDLEDLVSWSQNGSTRVLARFQFDADLSQALDEVKQRVANIRNLPVDIEPPVVYRRADTEPVSSLLVTGGDSASELIPIVREMEADLLARGIAQVRYNGLPEEEIAVLVDGKRMHEIELTLDDLAALIGRMSQDVPAGTVGRAQGLYQLRSLEKRRDARSFEDMTIEIGDRLVRLGDIAIVDKRPREGQPEVSQQGRPAIEMMLYRLTAEDAYLADRIVDGWLEDTRGTLPPSIDVEVTQDIWRLLGAQLDMVVKNGLSGLVLVIMTLFLFLNGRVGLWVMVGIPVSFLGGLAIFYGVFDQGISIIALIAFIMSLGIVVDDAIVVGEQTATEFENGKTPAQAAVDGAKRMWVPVATSSLTTLAAFVPLLIMGGEMGAAILALPTALLCFILASLVECFLVLPGHMRTTLGRYKAPAPSSFRARFDARFLRFRDETFAPLLKRALDHPGATVTGALASMVIAVSLIASQHLGINLVTGFDFESLSAEVEFSSSASDAEKAAFLEHLEASLDETNETIAGTNVSGWVRRENRAYFDEEYKSGVQFASISADYVYEEQRTTDPLSFANQWRDSVELPPFVERFHLGVDGGQNNGLPDITLVLRGDDLDELKQASEELTDVLAAYPGVSNVTDNLPYGKEQLIFSLTPAGNALGLSSDAVGRQLRAAYSGRRVQIFNENKSELEVRVLLNDAERDDLGQLLRYPIQTPNGDFVPLGNVATFTSRRGIDVIRHNDLRMAVSVSADVDSEKANKMAILKDVNENTIPRLAAQYGITTALSGATERDQLILETMQLGGLITLVFIYLILAWVFSSYLWPFAIMLAIPFGITGAIVGHWAMGFEIGAMSLLAFFSLTGIVVNDSIVLISFFKSNVSEGMTLKDALTKAVIARFRAVILTSLTTIAGLAPLIFETSSMDFYVAPIAITLCFGLAFATLLVLLVIPAFLLLLETGRNHFARVGARITQFLPNIPARLATESATSSAKENDNAAV